jgi:tetratricopeptide (TPR) repeat protein
MHLLDVLLVRPADAGLLEPVAAGLVARDGSAILTQRMEYERGELREALGDQDGALAHYQRQLEIAQREQLGGVWIELAYTALGRVSRRQGNRDAARGYEEAAIAIDDQLYGKSHPALVPILGNYANLLREDFGDYDGAIRVDERVLAIEERLRGADSRDAAAAAARLASSCVGRGDLTRAEALSARARGIVDAEPDRRDAARRDVYNDWSAVLVARERWAEAIAALREALASDPVEPDALDRAMLLELEARRGAPAAGLRAELAALDHDGQALPPRDRMTVAAGLCRVRVVLGDRDAVPACADALAGLRAFFPGDHPGVLEGEVALAQADLLAGDPAAARAPLEHVLAVLAARPGLPGLLDDARFALARALGPGDGERARQLARDAHDDLVTRIGDSERARQIEAWLARR